MAALVLVLAVWIFFRVRTGIVLEDALITYRHAENLALGRGFGFNPGERVLGTTSPLLTLLLAGLAAIVGVRFIPLISNVLMMAAGIGAVFLASGAVVRPTTSRTVPVLVMLLLGLQPDIVWCSAGGLETPLVLLFMTASLVAARQRRWSVAAIACGLAILTRIDASVWALVILGYATVRLRSGVVRPLAAGLAVVLPWFAFSWAYFGSALPHSMLAKQVIGAGALNLDYLAWVTNSLGVTFVRDMTPFEFPIWLLFVSSGIAACIASRRSHDLLPAALFPFAFGLALRLGKAPAFEWYTIPLTWCCMLLAVTGSYEVGQVLRAFGGIASWRPRTSGVVLGVAWAIVAVGLGARLSSTFEYHRAYQENEDRARRVVGEWLRSHARPGASVAMEAIGYQGTYSGLHVFDLAGIVSPEVVRLAREEGSNARMLARLLSTREPEFVVLRSFEVENNRSYYGGPLFESEQAREWFRSHYRKAFEVTAPNAELWGVVNSRISVFARVPAQ